MKTIKLLIAALMTIVVFQTSTAQTVTGLYLTKDDYLNNKLSYVTTGNKGSSITLHSAFLSPKVTVVTDGKKQSLLKSQLFGYQSEGQDYRFCNNRAYRIVENKDLYIYSYNTLIFQGKNMKPTQLYYFSAALDDVVQPLTIENIENAYAKNMKFKYMVESQFKTDNELASYDASAKQFKVKYLYDESMK